ERPAGTGYGFSDLGTSIVDTRPEVRLTVRGGAEGKVLIEHVDSTPQSSLFELYHLARRVALRVDEQVDSTLELINQL
ncbi:MAG: hypothetical protein KY476_11935, partial [Planctomycetes bacterium]|nr:hypothetical protein [Planctomycetota bacterium]